MTYGILIVAVTLGVAALPSVGLALPPCTVAEDEEVKPWGDLAWVDFQGPRLRNKREGAEIATSLRLNYRVAFTAAPGGGWVAVPTELCVAALMRKQLSGTAHDGRNGRSLAHEQVHFDIAEHFARQLCERLDGLQVREDTRDEAKRALERAIKREYAKGVRAWRGMEHHYDEETRHGLRSGRQRAWERRVRGLLSS